MRCFDLAIYPLGADLQFGALLKIFVLFVSFVDEMNLKQGKNYG